MQIAPRRLSAVAADSGIAVLRCRRALCAQIVDVAAPAALADHRVTDDGSAQRARVLLRRWTYQDCARVLIDFQKEIFDGIRSKRTVALADLNVPPFFTPISRALHDSESRFAVLIELAASFAPTTRGKRP